MASIEPRPRSDGSIGYRVNWRDPDHPDQHGRAGKRSLTFDDRGEAERLVVMLDANGQRLANAAAALKAIRDNGSTVAEMLEDYITNLTGIEEQTRQAYRNMAADHIVPILGALPAEAILRERIRGWVNQVSNPDPERYRALLMQARRDADLTRDQLAARLGWRVESVSGYESGRRPLAVDDLAAVCRALGISHTRRPVFATVAGGMGAKTLKNVHSLLSAAFTWAITERQLRQDNPAKGIKLKTYNPAEMTFLTPTEFGIFARQFAQPYRLVVHFLAGTGVRWGELIALQVTDLHLDVEHPYVSISKAVKRTPGGHYTGAPKSTRSRRLVSLPGSLVAQLRDHLAGRTEGLLFHGPRGARLHHSNFHSRQWVPAVAAARATDLPAGERVAKPVWRIHDLRHTHASWLIARGVDLATVQRRLGHESIVTTVDRYAHLDPRQLQAAADAVDAVLVDLITPPDHDPAAGGAVVDLEAARRALRETG